jgi:uncharacterized membrane-anchored protein
MTAQRRVDDVLQSAIAEGLVAPTATAPTDDDRPWPVVLLTAFGAWLAALPFIGLAGLMLADLMRHGIGAYVVGVGVLAGAIATLRRRDLPLFVEQLVVPMLIVGAALLAWGLFRDLPPATACLVLAAVSIVIASAIARTWLRVVLGAAAAALLALAWVPWHGRWWGAGAGVFWLAWHVNLLLWLGAGIARRTLLADGARARRAAALDALSSGWLLATLAGLAAWSGMTFLVGATLPGQELGDMVRSDSPRSSGTAMTSMRATSLLLAVATAAWAARRWPSLRHPASAGVAVVLVALAAFMPALGAALLALSVCATERRWRLAASAALTAAWIVGAFYYQLAWPLTTKAIVLVIAGVALGALAAFAWPRGRSGPIGADDDAPTWTWGGERSIPIRQLGIASTALLVLLVANGAIWQKEALIADGEPVFVELAPLDPRSLMQGDYMRLDFRIPTQLLEGAGGLLTRERPRIVARRDGRGVLTLLRRDQGEPLGADELRIELTPLHGDWGLVSDAWSFEEGQATRWARARYGEFRVARNGQALLVGLRGANLEKL